MVPAAKSPLFVVQVYILNITSHTGARKTFPVAPGAVFR
jgi:hypothetical protein